MKRGCGFMNLCWMNWRNTISSRSLQSTMMNCPFIWRKPMMDEWLQKRRLLFRQADEIRRKVRRTHRASRSYWGEMIFEYLKKRVSDLDGGCQVFDADSGVGIFWGVEKVFSAQTADSGHFWCDSCATPPFSTDSAYNRKMALTGKWLID